MVHLYTLVQICLNVCLCINLRKIKNKIYIKSINFVIGGSLTSNSEIGFGPVKRWETKSQVAVIAHLNVKDGCC